RSREISSREAVRAAREARREAESARRQLASVRRQLARELERAGVDDDVLEAIDDVLSDVDGRWQRRIAAMAESLLGGGGGRNDGDPLREMREMERRLAESRALTMAEQQARRRVGH